MVPMCSYHIVFQAHRYIYINIYREILVLVPVSVMVKPGG